MRILRRYLMRQVFAAVGLVLTALLLLFSFFDLIYQLRELGTSGLGLRQALLFVLLGVPAHLYELMPVAALIGTLLAIAQMVVHSEYAVMRTAGVSILSIGRALLQVGAVLAVFTFVSGEVLIPLSEGVVQKLRLDRSGGTAVAQASRSGLWLREGQSFVNVARILYDASLQEVRIYEFDADDRLRSITLAQRGRHLHSSAWLLRDLTLTRFEGTRVVVSRLAQMEWQSSLTPGVVNVLLTPPESMTLLTLSSYVAHLKANRQDATRYEVALWNKIIYPLAVLVMMVLALPFAYLNVRDGGVSGKIFAGIMLGLGFHLINRLFSHVGQLSAWPPLVAAGVPTLLFLTLAVAMLVRLERR